LSYQWDIQELVRNIYMDFSMRNFAGWMDIWGGMQGNTYEAMARAIENTRVIVVFLSKKYLLSPNCNVEFKYACRKNKPLVVIFVEDNLDLPDFVKKGIEHAPQFHVKAYGELSRSENGIPVIDHIADKVRKLGTGIASQESFYENSSDSEEIFNLKKLLRDTLDAIDKQKGTTRFKTCTRCNAQYDDNSKAGCKKHRIYYMGGNIMAGKWMCCRQLQDGIGCENADHTDAPRKWTLDRSCGTYTWVPA